MTTIKTCVMFVSQCPNLILLYLLALHHKFFLLISFFKFQLFPSKQRKVTGSSYFSKYVWKHTESSLWSMEIFNCLCWCCLVGGCGVFDKLPELLKLLDDVLCSCFPTKSLMKICMCCLSVRFNSWYVRRSPYIGLFKSTCDICY